MSASPESFDSAFTKAVDLGNKLADNHTATNPPPPFGALASDVLYVGADLFGGIAGTNDCASANKLIKTPTHPDPLIVALPVPLPAPLPSRPPTRWCTRVPAAAGLVRTSALHAGSRSVGAVPLKWRHRCWQPSHSMVWCVRSCTR